MFGCDSSTLSSSLRMRIDGVSKSSYCPRRTAHRKAIRKPSATVSDAIRRMTTTLIYANPSRRARYRVATVAKITTEMELAGIRMADTSGERWPVVANDSPMIL